MIVRREKFESLVQDIPLWGLCVDFILVAIAPGAPIVASCIQESMIKVQFSTSAMIIQGS